MRLSGLTIDLRVGYTGATAFGVLPAVSDHATRYQQLIEREIIKVLSALPLVLPILKTLGLREIVAALVVFGQRSGADQRGDARASLPAGKPLARTIG
jgi:hypothetical protein